MLDLEEKWNLLEEEVIKVQDIYPTWRKGQTFFNVLFWQEPDIANKIRATIYDCFHNDEKIPAFKEKLFELWKDENL